MSQTQSSKQIDLIMESKLRDKCRVIVRKLPPALTEDQFKGALDKVASGRYSGMSYHPGQSRCVEFDRHDQSPDIPPVFTIITRVLCLLHSWKNGCNHNHVSSNTLGNNTERAALAKNRLLICGHAVKLQFRSLM